MYAKFNLDISEIHRMRRFPNLDQYMESNPLI